MSSGSGSSRGGTARHTSGRNLDATDAWQESHYHVDLPETYIVQSGWIGYVELENRSHVYRVHQAGDVFTTPRRAIHNVYLPTGAVIHTVKHGNGIGEDRVVDPETKALDDHLKRVPESDLLSLASSPESRPTSSSRLAQVPYSDAYKHFDTLIWQVPAWTTAIAAIVFAGLTQLDGGSVIVGLARLSVGSVVAIACSLFGFFLIGLGYALFRFRRHQAQAKAAAPEHPLVSPQVYLQVLVNAQAAILFLLAALAVGGSPSVCLAIVLSLVTALVIYQERVMVKEAQARGRTVFKPS